MNNIPMKNPIFFKISFFAIAVVLFSTAIGLAQIPTDSDRDGVNDYREQKDGTDSNNGSSFDPLSKGLVAHYPLDGNPKDESGYGNDATAYGSVPVADRFSANSSAMYFDGASAYLQATHKDYLNTLPVTVSCWFRDQGSPSNEVGLVGKYQAAYWNGYQMVIQGDGSLWPWYVLNRGNDVIGNYEIGNDANPPFKSGNVKNGNWHHAVFSVDESGGNLYIDGIKVATKAWRGTPGLVTSSLPLTIGRYAGKGSGYFKGEIDDVRIYNRALNAAEVSQLYVQESVVSWQGIYSIVLGNFTWDEAKSDAESRGGHLATVGSEEEWQRIKPILSASQHLWLGATDSEQEGVWKWIDGTPWSFTNWGATEPNNSGNEDYLGIWPVNQQPNRSWFDASNYPQWGLLSGYVLEVENSTFPTANSWTTRWSAPKNNAPWYSHWSLALRSGKFLAGGVYSDDGISWKAFTLPSDIIYWLNNSGVADGVFLLNGAGNDLWTSPNGDNWTKRSNPGGYDDLTGIESGNGTIIVNRYWSPGSLLVSKNSGASWAYVDTGSFNYSPGSDGRHYERTVYGNNIFLFPLFDSVRTSADGLTWQTTAVSSRPSSFRMTSVGNFDLKTQKFVGVQQTSSNATTKTITTAVSSDGVIWTFRQATITTNNTAEFTGASIGQGYLVVGGGAPPEMWVSSDEGQTWSRINGPWEASGTTSVAFAANASRVIAATSTTIYSAELGQPPGDTISPIITLNGENPQEVYKGTAYTDPGAVVIDNVDAQRTIQGSGTVSASVVGTYTITYTATDAAGNTAEPVTRMVNVVLDTQHDKNSKGLFYWMDSDGDGMSDAQEYQLSNLGFDWQVPQIELVSAYYIQINLPPGELKMTFGNPLPFELSALGGTGPFVWEKTAGNLPPGVTMGSNGTLTGTPTASGKYQFTLKVTNSQGFSATRQVTLRIIPNSTFGGGYNFAHFAGRMFGFLGSGDSSSAFTGSGADSGGFTGSSDGSSSFTGSADFANLKPAVHAPSGVAVDALGNIYVSDSANNQIRKITTTGQIQNLAGAFTGSGGQDGTKWNARFANPQGMVCDATGNIYVADQDNHAIRKITANGTVTTVAGSHIAGNSSFTGSATGFSGSADGAGRTTARFNKPSDVAVDAAGNIYVADSGNHAIRKISTNGTVTTLAGNMGAAGNTNASGSIARFRSPQGIAVDKKGIVYVADTGNQVIRRITAAGAVTTFAGAAFTGSASPLGGRASFTGSAHSAFIGSADSNSLPVSVDGNATTARFSYPTDITIDSAGNLYVTDSGTEKIRRITANGTVTTLGGSPDGFFYNPLAVAAGANGTLYVADAGNNRIARGVPGRAALQPPVITIQPSSFENVYGNTNIIFSVSATGSQLAYQWYRNGTAVSKATSPTLKLKASVATEGTYTVAVSNAHGNVVSEPATLSLRPPAQWAWANQGPSQPVRPGDAVVFSVDDVAGPGSIKYQWFKNGVAIRGKTGSTLTIPAAGIADSGVYSLEISSAAGQVVTEGQALYVEDTGTLVYKIRATGTSAEGAKSTNARLVGYLVRDRSAATSCFLWVNPAQKTWFVEWMPDLIMKTTGPMAGSTSILRAHLEESENEETIWLSGIDGVVKIGGTTQVLAPAKLDGQFNTVTNEQSTVIEMLKATLRLDSGQTLKAITIDGSGEATVKRLTDELAAKGYQPLQ